MAQSGDKCKATGCPGRLRARTSRRVGDKYVRHLECNRCGVDGGKEVIDADRVWNRSAST